MVIEGLAGEMEDVEKNKQGKEKNKKKEKDKKSEETKDGSVKQISMDEEQQMNEIEGEENLQNKSERKTQVVCKAIEETRNDATAEEAENVLSRVLPHSAARNVAPTRMK